MCKKICLNLKHIFYSVHKNRVEAPLDTSKKVNEVSVHWLVLRA